MTDRNPRREDPLPDHLPRWLEAVSRRLYSELGAVARQDFPGLRGSHRRILQMIPPTGIRITDLARLAAMTKQSLGEFVDRLEADGYVVSGRDPADGRVRLVSRTVLGDEAADAAQRAIMTVEEAWRSEVGPADFDKMKDVLRRLGKDSLRI
jgi:DNA-binding MarR family transcriptional regulator